MVLGQALVACGLVGQAGLAGLQGAADAVEDARADLAAGELVWRWGPGTLEC